MSSTVYTFTPGDRVWYTMPPDQDGPSPAISGTIVGAMVQATWEVALDTGSTIRARVSDLEPAPSLKPGDRIVYFGSGLSGGSPAREPGVLKATTVGGMQIDLDAGNPGGGGLIVPASTLRSERPLGLPATKFTPQKKSGFAYASVYGEKARPITVNLTLTDLGLLVDVLEGAYSAMGDGASKSALHRIWKSYDEVGRHEAFEAARADALALRQEMDPKL